MGAVLGCVSRPGWWDRECSQGTSWAIGRGGAGRHTTEPPATRVVVESSKNLVIVSRFPAV
jgi:hypothetical protein